MKSTQPDSFRPLSGLCSSNLRYGTLEEVPAEFPSPFDVSNRKLNRINTQRHVSVPFRGYVVVITVDTKVLKERYADTFPSPFGVM